MSAAIDCHFGFTLHRITRRLFTEVAISVCASLAVVAILASGAPRWPKFSPAIERPKLTARVEADPQLASFVESAALAHVGSERNEIFVQPPKFVQPAKLRVATLAPELRKPRPNPPREAWPTVLPPSRPADLAAPIAVSAPAQKPQPATFGFGSQLLGDLARVLPSGQSLVAQAGEIGSKIAGLVPRIR
ncbi:MAG TPA: hypothetical protein VND97_07980 [Beijerinckiaceae bacterium]|nr:hypothetical protein [Beijerinckiaceae bacterium]